MEESGLESAAYLFHGCENLVEVTGFGHLVTVTISISPQEGYEYYSLEMSVTGAFTASEKIGKDELERTLLTAGTEELYDFAKDRAAILMQGGAFGEPTFPMLKFRFDSEQ